MQKAVIAVILIVNIAFSGAVFLKKPATATFSIFNQLQEVENSDFGKKILDTIALQMKNKSPLQDVAKMLAEIRADLSAQQLASDQLHDQQEAECDSEIKEYERRINVADGIRQQAEDEIATLKQEISQLEGEIRNKKQQQEILNQREIDLRESRARDADEFARRQAQTVEVVGALDLIIEKFSTIKGQESAEAALADLSKLGSTNPIMALVQVASTFSQESLDKVKAKLEELRVNLQASLESDKQNEQAAIGEYEALMQELEEVRKSVAQALAEAELKLKQAQSALALQEKILADAVAELKSAQEGKAQKERQCEDWRNKYASDKEQRSKEIGVVKQVEEIIATKLETMKDYLKERAGLN